MRIILTWLFCGTLFLTVSVERAVAIPNFKKQFAAKYADKEGSDEQKAVAEAMGKGKQSCTVCHMGKSKKKRNAYGEALSELLDKKKDKKDVEKIIQALETVESMKADPDDSDTMTFGDRLKAGKLPVEAEVEAEAEAEAEEEEEGSGTHEGSGGSDKK